MADNAERGKSKIVQSISKIISGFLTGIGFSIALIIVFLAAGYVWDNAKEDTNAEKEDVDLSSIERYSSKFIEFDENSGLILENHEARKYETELTIIGQIKNTGQENWERIHLEVELFDSNKAFLDQCSGLVWGIIKPAQTRNFKITCGGCDNEPLVEFSTYEVSVVNASHKEKY